MAALNLQTSGGNKMSCSKNAGIKINVFASLMKKILTEVAVDSQLLSPPRGSLFELEGNSQNFSLELGTFIWKV